MQRFYSIITFLCLLTTLVCAQNNNENLPPENENLIFNPSFEEYTECPKRIEATGHLSIVDGWFQPTGGSADYFNRCSNGACGVPRSKMGFQEPHSGQGYCGIYCNKTEYREYLQTELKQPLRAGCTYRVTFYVSLSEYSTCAIATMGALLTPNRVEDTARNMLTKKEIRKLDNGMKQSISAYFIPQVQNNYSKPLTDWRRWQKISGTFKAEGGERFLTIGNFTTAAKSNITVPDSLTQELTGSYYFIDDVSLVLIDCTKEVADNPAPITIPIKTKKEKGKQEKVVEEFEGQPLTKGSVIVLRNIFFDFDKSTLLQQSYKELQGLLSLMKKHPSMKVQIIGHTDNQGSVTYNMRLSENRAKAVVDYLIKRGIDAKRLQYKGRGAYEPIDTNATEEGRANNRRVEMKILSM